MASSGMLRHVALVKTDVSEELSASIIRVTRIGELGTTLTVTSNRRTETSVFPRATWCKLPEDPILHSHRRENLMSYVTLTGSTL
jgi:ABC-type molybdate transport system permease subunit